MNMPITPRSFLVPFYNPSLTSSLFLGKHCSASYCYRLVYTCSVVVVSHSVVSNSCDPMGCCLPGSSAHGIFQAGILEWVAISFQGIFPAQGSNPCLLHLLHCRRILLLTQPPGKKAHNIFWNLANTESYLLCLVGSCFFCVKIHPCLNVSAVHSFWVMSSTALLSGYRCQFPSSVYLWIDIRWLPVWS